MRPTCSPTAGNGRQIRFLPRWRHWGGCSPRQDMRPAISESGMTREPLGGSGAPKKDRRSFPTLRRFPTTSTPTTTSSPTSRRSISCVRGNRPGRSPWWSTWSTPTTSAGGSGCTRMADPTRKRKVFPNCHPISSSTISRTGVRRYSISAVPISGRARPLTGVLCCSGST